MSTMTAIRKWVLKQLGIEDNNEAPTMKLFGGDMHVHFHLNFDLGGLFKGGENGKDTE